MKYFHDNNGTRRQEEILFGERTILYVEIVSGRSVTERAVAGYVDKTYVDIESGHTITEYTAVTEDEKGAVAAFLKELKGNKLEKPLKFF